MNTQSVFLLHYNLIFDVYFLLWISFCVEFSVILKCRAMWIIRI